MVGVRTAFLQSHARIRFGWGLTGALALAEQPGTISVVVDVLSFSTAVSVAGDLGIEIFPFRWRDDRAATFAESVGAELATGRRQGNPSLSPASIREWGRSRGRPNSAAADSPTSRLVLPSPNGSSICFALADRGVPVLAGCLRNASAVAAWLAGRLLTDRACSIGVVAAGERWPDGSLRPAIEDLLGAGAVLARVHRAAPGIAMSPEARTAIAAFATVERELPRQLADCASGLELLEDGFADDVTIAADLDASTGVPVLAGDRFRPD
jgi:2-phosphosulfolactate phosphatase